MKLNGLVPIKLYSHKQAGGWLWPTGGHLPMPGLTACSKYWLWGGADPGGCCPLGFLPRGGHGLQPGPQHPGISFPERKVGGTWGEGRAPADGAATPQTSMSVQTR